MIYNVVINGQYVLKLLLFVQFNGPIDTVINSTELDCPVPTDEVWRYGKPGTKLGDSIFMTIARAGHRRLENNLFAKQQELRKTHSILLYSEDPKSGHVRIWNGQKREDYNDSNG